VVRYIVTTTSPQVCCRTTLRNLNAQLYNCQSVSGTLDRTKRDDNISTGTPLTGASNARWVGKKSRFSTNMSLYLANDAR